MTFDRYALLWVDLGVLFGLAWLVCLFVKNPLAKQVACRGALAGSIFLTLVVLFGSERHAPVAPVEARTIVVKAAAVVEAAPTVLGIKSESLSVKAESSTTSSSRFASTSVPVDEPYGNPVEMLLVPIYMAGLCLTGSLYLLSLLRLRGLHKGSSSVIDERVSDIAERVRRSIGLRELRARILDGDVGVFVAGALRPTIYAGRTWLDKRSDNDLEAFLLHEAAHVIRGDLRWQAFHLFVRIVFWPQPFVWLVTKGLNRSAEELCDRHVVAGGIEPARFADGLLRVAERLKAPVAGYGLFGSKSGLSRRIEALINGANTRIVQMSKRARISSILAIIATVSCIGYVFAVPAYEDELNDTQPSTRVVTFIGPNGKPMKEGRVTYLNYRTFKDIEEKHLKLVNGSVNVRCQNLRFGMEYLCIESPKIGLSYCNFTRQSPEKVTVKCLKPTTLVGKLLLPSGLPAAGVKVCVQSAVDRVNHSTVHLLAIGQLSKRLTQTTDSQGYFRFPNMPSEAEIYLVVDDKRFAQLDYQLRAFTGFEDNYRVSLKPHKAKPINMMDSMLHGPRMGYREITHVPPIRLRPAATIEGRVTRDGKPVAGVPVQHEVVDQSGTMPIPVTDENGYYKIEQVRSGTVNVLPHIDWKKLGDVAAALKEGLHVAEGQHLKGIDFELVPGATIEGTMFDRNGKPLPYGHVVIQPGSSASMLLISKYCDRNGRFHVRVGPGRIHMMGGIEFNIADGETKTVDLHYPSEVPVQYAK